MPSEVNERRKTNIRKATATGRLRVARRPAISMARTDQSPSFSSGLVKVLPFQNRPKAAVRRNAAKRGGPDVLALQHRCFAKTSLKKVLFVSSGRVIEV